jgi:flagella basal body P-ring formation protein FlgA
MKKILFITLLLFNYVAAASLEAVIKEVEDNIARDRGIDNVIVTLKHTNSKDSEYIGFQYLSNNNILVTVDQKGQQNCIQGKYEQADIFPMFKVKVHKGYVLSEDDIEYRKYASSKIRGQYIKDIDQIVGKTAKRTVIANKPIKNEDLGSSTIIKKGSNVQIHYKKGKLYIEAAGVALEDGGLGEIIKIKNIDSNKSIKGKVRSETEVEVSR